MEQARQLTFGPFRLDTTANRLWRGEHTIALRPRSFGVLRYLVEHPGRLVTKAELHQHVWMGTHVTDTVLRVSIREIRAVLGDSAAVPQYIETVGGQGYRFLAGDDQTISPRPMAGLITGRQREVETLEGWFQHAATGERQLVFISGEAGIGKTTVLDLFCARVAQGQPVRLGQGQCVEHYGEGEPYLPLLEALGQLSRGPTGPEVLATLRRYAPMWLMQLPGLLGEADLERVQRQVQGATQTRMVRELADVLYVLTVDRPLVLVLEDLHWSDASTVECLAALAQRREPARLLVLGTYRPMEMVLRTHPLQGLVQELCGRGQAVELRLELLSAADVAAYVAGRLGGPVAASLAALVYERTEGNALFMAHLVEHLVQQGLVVRQGGQWASRLGAEVVSLPAGLRQLLGRHIETLPASAQRVLEAASVMGKTFAAVAVAAGVQLSVEDVEVVCDELVAQQHLLDDMGLTVWPDGSSGGSYRFRHVLYQQVLYERLGVTRRAQLHRRIGARLEAGYGARAGEVAAQLAVHFERGGDLQRVYELCQQGEESLKLGVVLHGLANFYNNRSEFQTALDIEARLLWIAQQHHNAVLLAAAYRLLGSTWLFRGDFVGARQHLEQSVRQATPVQDGVLAALSSREGESLGRSMLAAVLARLGYPEQARQRNHEAMTLTQEQPTSFLRAIALLFTAIVGQFCRDIQGTCASAEAVMTLVTEQGFVMFRSLGMALHGWACAMQGQEEAGIAEIRQGLAAHAATGARLAQPYMLAMLAEAYGAVGQVAEALTTLDEALTLVHTTGEAHIAAHLYGFKGKLLLVPHDASPEAGESEACLQQALDVARSQQARALELRAAVSLSRLWQRQGKRAEARQLLAPIYGWFTEGFDTADLQEARALLEELER